MKNKGQTKIIIIVAIVVIILIGGGFYYGSITGGVIDENNCREVETSYEETVENVEYYTETVPYIDNVCNEEELAYKVENWVMDFNNCNEEKYICHDDRWWGCADEEYYCVDRSIACSLDLYNLDAEESGWWDINFNFIERETSNLVREDTETLSLYPQSSGHIQGAVRIQSEGVDGDSNKNLNCRYSLPIRATKQICEEVTKYKEVQREKVVTKPVTKYKTETVCE